MPCPPYPQNTYQNTPSSVGLLVVLWRYGGVELHRQGCFMAHITQGIAVIAIVSLVAVLLLRRMEPSGCDTDDVA